MLAMPADRLNRVAAWPIETLHEASGSVVGFLMRKAGGHRPVFQLYGPKLRLREFPRADWRFLIHVAGNVARAFSTVHAAGLVVGDVNHGNLVVAQDGVVCMIDCDSYQVIKGGQTWYCEVGTGTHQPPELQAITSYEGVPRSPNHDSFGLAVIIFQLLCIARHPFAGRHLGSGEPPSIEEAIARSRYAYSRDRTRTQLAPPPGSLAIEALTPGIQELFEQAFSPGSVDRGRPTPDRWVAALQELGADLRQCSVNRGHHFCNGLAACPWCVIEATSGTVLFPALFVTVAGQPGGMVALWQQVMAVAEPAALPPFRELTGVGVGPSLAAVDTGRKARLERLTAYLLAPAAALGALTLMPSGLGTLVTLGAGCLAYLSTKQPIRVADNEFRRRVRDAERDWGALGREWMQPAPRASFAQERAKLTAVKERHDALPNERAARLQKLAENRRQQQLDAYLDGFVIATNRIPGIGRAKVATLSAYGIDTAADIAEARILAIPGFGPAITRKLLAWRLQHEREFRFDPSKGLAAADTLQVERDIAMERNRLENQVAAGLSGLRAIAAANLARSRALEGRLAELQPRLAQVKVDANAAGPSMVAHRRVSGVSLAVLVLAVAAGLNADGPLQHASIPAQVDASGPVLPLKPGPLVQAPAKLKPTPDAGDRDAPTIRRFPSIDEGRRGQRLPELPGRMVARQAANVREAPNLAAAVARTLPSGFALNVFGQSNGWIQVGGDQPWGWVYSGLLAPASPLGSP